jgi:hypothetical protein
MTRKLDEADRAAVDLLFDRINANGNGNGNGGDGFQTVSHVVVAEARLSAVERILSTLDQMPAPEPSSDLVIRTLQRVSRSSAGGAIQPTPAQFIDPTQPMA